MTHGDWVQVRTHIIVISGLDITILSRTYPFENRHPVIQMSTTMIETLSEDTGLNPTVK